jgi:hypothetical protein
VDEVGRGEGVEKNLLVVFGGVRGVDPEFFAEDFGLGIGIPAGEDGVAGMIGRRSGRGGLIGGVEGRDGKGDDGGKKRGEHFAGRQRAVHAGSLA